MKKITVEVCACTQCVLNGAMHIIESIESLKKLKVQLRMNAQVNIVTTPSLVEGKHSEISPVVRINGEMLEKADSETVMARIISQGQRASG
ncbi:MAG: hypothetical protein HFG26_03580 [Provencibacterium sp.]|jgi:NADH:ubiquinone oxidoreductase subunit E|nr:hypothetical protein [Provencibacterium sp.]